MLDKLLKPISGDNPCGKDPRSDVTPHSLYYKLKDARNQARTIERQAMSVTMPDEAKAQWRIVQEVAIDILSNHAKDIEVASALLEAWVRQSGFSGLQSGLKFISELLSQYWAGIFPLPDEDGDEMRIAPFVGLSGGETEGALIAPIRQCEITRGKSAGPYALWQYQQALQIDAMTDRDQKQARIDSGAIELAQIKAALKETQSEFYVELEAQVTDCLNLLESIDAFLTEKCGNDAPSFSNIRRVLNDFIEHIAYIRKEAGFAAVPIAVKADLQDVINTPINNDTLDSRDKALRQLDEVSRYFKLAEPQSPVPYLIERAIRWATMPLHEWLSELIEDEKALEESFKLTGISGVFSESKTTE